MTRFSKFLEKPKPAMSTFEEFLAFHEECVTLLRSNRGVPKEQQIRELLATYYSMHQNPDESVSDFVHRFLETQHSLEKLSPGIHRSSAAPSGDMELIHAFTMKLNPAIAKAQVVTGIRLPLKPLSLRVVNKLRVMTKCERLLRLITD